VSLKAKTLAELPAGAVVGTASLRRQAQVLFARPDLRVSVLRGNVDTRLAKLEAGDVDATFLALAGLKRMGLENRATSLVEAEDMLPAACQGAIAITAREDNMRVLEELAKCEDYDARVEVEAERGFLDQLDGSCRTPIGALARLSPDRRYEGGAIFAQLTITGELLRPDGTQRWRLTRDYLLGHDAYHIAARERGEMIAQEIRDEAGDAIVLDT
jgi:hydroxymethylbilane synthase